MASNPVSCSNCGTENPPGQDFCTECDQPLTASADQGLRESEEAQDHGGVIGGDAVGPAGAATPLTSDTDTTDGEMRPLSRQRPPPSPGSFGGRLAELPHERCAA